MGRCLHPCPANNTHLVRVEVKLRTVAQMSSHGSHDCCGHESATYSTHQSLDEMEFERGVWSAAMDGELTRVEKYIDGGGDPDATDSSGYAALHYAARNGHIDVCKRLLTAGAKVNIQTRSGGATALHRASYCGHVDVVQLLLARGAQPSMMDSDGQTCLHKAAERGHEKVVKLLIKTQSTLINVRDKRGRQPVDCLPKDKQHLHDLLSPT